MSIHFRGLQMWHHEPSGSIPILISSAAKFAAIHWTVFWALNPLDPPLTGHYGYQGYPDRTLQHSQRNTCSQIYRSIITMGTLKGNRRFLLMIHLNKSSTRMIRFTKEPKAFDAILAATKVGSSFEWPLMAHVSCISDLQDLETWRLAAQLWPSDHPVVMDCHDLKHVTMSELPHAPRGSTPWGCVNEGIRYTSSYGSVRKMLTNHFGGTVYIWWVVSTPLKNISQLRWLFPIHGKIKMFQTTHQPDIYIYI